MFITREAYEKALRRARAEGRKEIIQKVQVNDRIACVERSMDERTEHVIQRIDRLHCEVREMKDQRDSKADHVCICKSGE